MSPARILVVDDDRALARFMVEVLSDAHHEVASVQSATEALSWLEGERVELVVTDLRMPGLSGLELIDRMRQDHAGVAVLAVTAYGSIETAVQAIRRGASDYLTKPFEPDALLLAVDRCVRERRLQQEVRRLRSEVDRRCGFEAVVARSVVMQEVVALAERVADSPSTILLTGPSGSGKEVLGRAIHQASRRRSRPFIAVNCAAIPDALLESELFGHKKGAFTGAMADKPGLFQEAHGGTLFLDEIGDLPLPLQAKLLRVLQDHEVRPVGANRGTSVDFRLLAATHRELREEVAQGRFRQDLFYRLCVIELVLPALADRPEDVVPLAERFLGDACGRLQRGPFTLSGETRRVLCAYDWPGNVRELQNAIEHAVNMAMGDELTPEDLPAVVRRPREATFLDRAAEQQLTIAELNRTYARRVLAIVGGNKKKAATRLGIDRSTMYRWLGDDPGDLSEDEDAAPKDK
ncbi:MAG: sigma-54-dependent Fis family transcriptional regulator [Deltaproteobacteria bacterium]|nr:sigma-54-dependent Fis family transcriptional regulator [Deltaproteobacteria bacterium]